MLREARKEIGSFEKAGRRKDDPNHLVEKWGLGDGWRAEREGEKAKAAFKAAIKSARDSFSGIQADRELYDLLHPSAGRRAPQFSAAAINGADLALRTRRSRLSARILGVSWRQICDGKADAGEIARLYNVRGAPDPFVIDRVGGRYLFRGQAL